MAIRDANDNFKKIYISDIDKKKVFICDSPSRKERYHEGTTRGWETHENRGNFNEGETPFGKPYLRPFVCNAAQVTLQTDG